MRSKIMLSKRLNTNFVLKTKYEKYGTDFEDKIDKIDKKIPDVTNLVKKQILILKSLK